MKAAAIFESRLRRLLASGGGDHLRGGRRGLERETLRVTPDGYISRASHPRQLGSTLTNQYITTDYSEALLEFITPPQTDNDATLQFLADIQHFAYAAIDQELLWAFSMPCMIRSEEDIPIAQYGSSNVGRMKTIYRRGLGLRYGRYMQAIAGVHFNYSVPDEFWPALADADRSTRPLAEFKSESYMGLVRNVRRTDWLLLYLFGASPAVCKCFLPDGDTGLSELDKGTYYAPFATSLRMSDIGYKNKSQAGIRISANSLHQYVRDLGKAIRTPDADYEKLGVRADGEYQQLNPNRLQIENEYYSTIRPKRATLSGERPTSALMRGGIEYAELRALDVSPFDAVGIAPATLDFCEAFLIYALLAESAPIRPEDQQEVDRNHSEVARRGRQPDLVLSRGGSVISMKKWASEILADVRLVAEALDSGSSHRYVAAVREAQVAVDEADATPSARLLRELRASGATLASYGLDRSREIRDRFAALPTAQNSRWEMLLRESERSLEQQRWIEEHDRVSFEEYLESYYA
jgi:glutamate--cysteine ligase